MPTATLPPTAPWEPLLPAALAGTRRRPFAPLPGFTPPPDRRDLTDPIDQGSHQLLRTAANLQLVLRAGYRPPGGPAEEPPPASAEPWPPLPAAAARLLLAGLHDAQCHPSLPAYLALLYPYRRRLPRWAVWRALSGVVGVSAPLNPERRYFPLEPNHFPALFGRLGQWLAAQHPDAALRAEAGRLNTDWRPGATPLQQQGTLRHWQLLGEWPAVQVAQLRTTLLRPPSEALRQLLRLLSNHPRALPPSLHPTLEALLDSPDETVSSLALFLLGWGQPGYDLAGRAWQVAEFFLRLEPGETGPRLRVQPLPPRPWPATWLRAGIYPPFDFADHPAGRLEALLAATEPSRWPAAWGVSAAEAVALAQASPDAEAILRGWQQGAGRYGDVAMARALLAAWPMPAPDQPDVHGPLAALRTLLPPAEQLTWLERAFPALPPDCRMTPVKDTNSVRLPHWVDALRNVPGHSLALDEWLLGHLHRYATDEPAASHSGLWHLLSALLGTVGRLADPAALPRLQAAASPAAGLAPSHAVLFAQAATQLAFRARIPAVLAELEATRA